MIAPLPAQRPLLPTALRALPDRRLVAFLPVHIALTTLVMTVGLGAIGLRLYDSPSSHAPIAVATGLAVIGLTAYARYFLRLPWLSASVVYLVLFWIFHFGMTFTAVLVPSVLTPLSDGQIEWFRWPSVRMAMILGVIGAAGFVFGAGFFATRSSTREANSPDRTHYPGLYGGGWLIMSGGITASVLVIAQNVGLGVFSMGYLDFLSLTGSTPLGPTLWLSHLGCLLAICGAGGRRWVKPLVVWGAFVGLPMLVLGARSATMVPLVSFAVILTLRGVRFSRWVLAAALLASLIAIPAIQAFRLVGFANRSEVHWTDVTPLDTLMELGGSLQAVRAYVDWIEDGEEYLLGASYWGPIDRQVLTRLVPGRERIPYEQDERIPGRLMIREGPIGLSSTGEAYFNFGAIGPFMYFALVGALFGWLDRRALRSRYACATLGAVIILFYFNIRGEWLAIPATLGLNLALVGLCCWFDRCFIDREGDTACAGSARHGRNPH
jgi:hypothetical protein